MRIRLTQPGFATYSGQMGVMTFTDGLSDHDVRPQDAIRMAAVMQCEWEDGRPANVAQAILDHAHTPASIEVKNELNGDAAIRQQQAEANGTTTPAEVRLDDLAAPGTLYTSAELEAIADAEGIKGLRKIAGPLGIKGNSINELIREIVSANAAKG